MRKPRAGATEHEETKTRSARACATSFDKTMAAGPIALIGWLAVVSLLIIVIAGAFLALTGSRPKAARRCRFVEAFWEALMRTLDCRHDGRRCRLGVPLVMLVVTLGGIFVVSALIGVLSAGVDSKLDELRKGRSRVLESDHTIILNWSPSIFDIISELVVANASRKRPRIVIMAEQGQGRDGGRDRRQGAGAAQHAGHLPQRRSDRPLRSGDRQPAELALDHRAVAGRRRSGFAGHQVGAGAGQRSRAARRSRTASPPRSAT